MDLYNNIINKVFEFQSTINLSVIDNYFEHVDYCLEIRIESAKIQIEEAGEKLIEQSVRAIHEAKHHSRAAVNRRYVRRGLLFHKGSYKSVFYTSAYNPRMNLFKFKFPISQDEFWQLENELFRNREVFRFGSTFNYVKDETVSSAQLFIQVTNDVIYYNWDFYFRPGTNNFSIYFDLARFDSIFSKSFN